MKRKLFLICCLGAITFSTLTSCRGSSASKAAKIIQKSTKNVGKYGDDVYRAVNRSGSNTSTTPEPVATPVSYQCPSCSGYGQVNFLDQYGYYSHTGTCPDCHGTGAIVRYEY